MKTNFLKIKLLPLLLFAFGMMTMTACDKDDDTTPVNIKSKIVGTWDFTSFKVGNSEYMGTIVDSSYVTFGAIQVNKGDFEQTITYADGETEAIAGEYEIDENKDEVKMTADGETEVIKITLINDTNMNWSGTQDGKTLIIKTVRRD